MTKTYKKTALSFILLGVMLFSACGAANFSREAENSSMNGSSMYFSFNESHDFDSTVSFAHSGGALTVNSAPSAMVADSAASVAQSTSVSQNQNVEIREAMLIKRANITLETNYFDEDESIIRNLISQAGGFSERSDINTFTDRNNNQLKRGNFTFRVPSQTFEWVLSDMKGLGRMISVSSSAEDASTTFHDTQSRLNQSRIQEERLEEILRYADTVSEMMQIERRLSEIRTDIELFQSRLNSISSLSAYSTITLTLIETTRPVDETEPEPPEGLLARMWHGFRMSLSAMGTFFRGFLITLSFIALPLLFVGVITGIVLFIIFKVVKRKKP